MSRAFRVGAALHGGLALLLGQPGCLPPTSSDNRIATIEVFGVAEVTVGSSITLYTIRKNANGSTIDEPGDISWFSSDETVASVGEKTGVVTGIKQGTVTITATSGSVGGFKSITVKPLPPVPVSSVTVSGPASLKKYEQATFTAALKDFNGNDVFRPVAWTSSDPAKASVVSATGVVTAVSEGTVTITATAEGRSGTAQLTVAPPAVDRVTVLGASSVLRGFTTSLTTRLEDSHGQTLTDRSVTWSSSDQSKATVSSQGLVFGVALGTVTITAASEGKTGTQQVTVTSSPTEVRITGRVIDGTNQNGIPGACVSVLKLDGNPLTFCATTAADGSFTTSSFTVPAEGIRVEAIKTGYVTGRIQVTTPLNGDPAGVESIPLVPTSTAKGAISGVVRDARTGLPIAGASLALYDNVASAPLSPGTANGSGVYTFSNLNAGTYRVSATASGYQLVERIGIAVGNNGVTGDQDLVLPPTGSTDIRIVLTWGADPSDLDSHLTGPNGANRFHVYYASRGSFSSAPFAGLDIDDVTSYGPETISITQMSPGNYRYSVHDFTNRNSASSTALGNSGAVVRVYGAAGLYFTAPVPQGTGNLWTVFELSGTLANPIFTPRNELSFVSVPSTVPAPPAVSSATDADVIARAIWGPGRRKAPRGKLD